MLEFQTLRDSQTIEIYPNEIVREQNCNLIKLKTTKQFICKYGESIEAAANNFTTTKNRGIIAKTVAKCIA